MRAGSHGLTLLGSSRIHPILKSLSGGTKSQTELRRETGSPAQSTLRGRLRLLLDADTIERRRRDSFPGTLDYNLTETGHELLVVAGSIETWLALAPRGSSELGGDTARATIKGLVDGWDATILSTLSDGPLSLTEIDKRISVASYPTIERALDTMRIVELLDIGERSPRGTPYAMTDWLRRGLVPLAFGARWEHRLDGEDCAPVSRVDVDDALLIATPLLVLSGQLNGLCQLALRTANAKSQDRPLSFLEVQAGKISSGATKPDRKPDAWASGTRDSWFATVIHADTDGLRMSGDRTFTGAIFDGMHRGLFGPSPAPQEPDGARSSSTS